MKKSKQVCTVFDCSKRCRVFDEFRRVLDLLVFNESTFYPICGADKMARLGWGLAYLFRYEKF